MSTPPPAARSQRATRIALIQARTGLNPIMIALLPILAITYAYFAQAAELIGQSGIAVLLLTVLAVLCFIGITLRPTGDRLELFRVFSFYFLMAFCVAPLFEPAISLYRFDDPKPLLLRWSAAFALFAYLCVALGYHLPFYPRAPRTVESRHDEYGAGIAGAIGLAVFLVGTISFLVLFVAAGGAAVILRGEGAVHRTEFAFGGLGWFYWASLFMLPGGAIYFAAQASRRRNLAWIHAWPLVSAFALLLLLQGRHRAMAPILVTFAISHYLVRRIRLGRLAIYGTIGVALAIVMSAARSPQHRGLFTRDPILFTSAVLSDFDDGVRSVMSGDIGRLDELMIVVDHVPDRMAYDYGWSLTIPLNPIRRRIYGANWEVHEAPMVGERLYLISRPDMRGAAYRTGFLPSIVGEMRANFPAPLCFFPFVLFGMALRYVYQRLVVHGASFMSIAAYAIIGLFLCNSVVGAIAQSFFEMMVVALPVFVVQRIARRSGMRARQRVLSEAVPSSGP
jgi:hypothetical protein